jgi:hypothetical protein
MIIEIDDQYYQFLKIESEVMASNAKFTESDFFQPEIQSNNY